MKKTVSIILLGIMVLLSACSPKITTSLKSNYPALNANANIAVFELYDTIPARTEILGTVRVGDTGFTMKCDYATVLEVAKLEARKAGGNAIKITDHVLPGFVSSCHQIKVDILKFDKELTITSVQPQSAPIILKRPYSHFRLALNAGYSYNLGKTDKTLDAQIQAYNKELRSCTLLGADISYFINEQSGIGLNYNVIRTRNSMDGVSLSNNDEFIASGTLSDDIKVSFVGPTYSMRQTTGKSNKNAFFLNVGLGYMEYLSNEKFSNYYNYNITGSTLGFLTSIGFDHSVSKHMALGIQLSLVSGTLVAVDLFDGVSNNHILLDENSTISIGHLDFTVGLRFK